MLEDDLRLLENLLDAFDRLSDDESGVADVEALLFAAARAVKDSAWSSPIDLAAQTLWRISRSGRSAEDARSEALSALQPLRERTAQALRSR